MSSAQNLVRATWGLWVQTAPCISRARAGQVPTTAGGMSDDLQEPGLVNHGAHHTLPGSGPFERGMSPAGEKRGQVVS